MLEREIYSHGKRTDDKENDTISLIVLSVDS